MTAASAPPRTRPKAHPPAGPRTRGVPGESVEDIVRLLRTGQVSAVDLAERALRRIGDLDRSGPAWRAVVCVDESARDQAAASDRRRREGRARGPLDGVPVVVKDCVEAVGTATTHGSALFADWRPARDATSVARLREAGAVILAKVSLDDFAAATVGRSSLVGLMRNPFDPSRSTGGSSGGSAVAVAVGYAPLAVGTDTGGSLRIPAAACGVVAIRPTPGLVSRAGVFPRSFDQDVVGPMATTVRGAALGLAAMAGYDPADPMTGRAVGASRAGGSRGTALGGLLDRLLGGAAATPGPGRGPVLAGLRLGVVRTGLAIWGDDPGGGVARAFEVALDEVRRHGATLVDLPAPPRELLDGTSVVTAQSAAAVDAYLRQRPDAPVGTFAELVSTGAFTDDARVAFERELAFDPASLAGDAAYQRARARRLDLLDVTFDSWARHRIDAVLYPTAQRVAALAGREQDGVYTRWAEHAGLPALTMPMAWVRPDEGGAPLPANIEIVARPFDEPFLVALGCAIESALSVPRTPGAHRTGLPSR